MKKLFAGLALAAALAPLSAFASYLPYNSSYQGSYLQPQQQYMGYQPSSYYYPQYSNQYSNSWYQNSYQNYYYPQQQYSYPSYNRQYSYQPNIYVNTSSSYGGWGGYGYSGW